MSAARLGQLLTSDGITPDKDVIAYIRETRTERLLCLASRAPHEPVRLPLRAEETLYGEDPDGDRFSADGPSFHVWRVTNG